MTITEVIKNAIEKNERKLQEYYNDPTDTRNECDPEIEQIRTNILNLKILYVRKTTDLTDEDEILELASNM